MPIQVKQNLHDAVTEYAKLKQQLEKNTTVIGMLQHLQEVMLHSLFLCHFLADKPELCFQACGVLYKTTMQRKLTIVCVFAYIRAFVTCIIYLYGFDMLLKFDTAMEEYHRALQEKNYVVAAKQHGTVSQIYAFTICYGET